MSALISRVDLNSLAIAFLLVAFVGLALYVFAVTHYLEELRSEIHRERTAGEEIRRELRNIPRRDEIER